MGWLEDADLRQMCSCQKMGPTIKTTSEGRFRCHPKMLYEKQQQCLNKLQNGENQNQQQTREHVLRLRAKAGFSGTPRQKGLPERDRGYSAEKFGNQGSMLLGQANQCLVVAEVKTKVRHICQWS